MASEIKGKDKEVAPAVPGNQKKAMKYVRNRSGHRVELMIDNKIVVFLPGSVTTVPSDFEVPNNLGLHVKW